jgi:hypothetical protein
LRRGSISVDEEQLWRRRIRTTATAWSTTLTTTTTGRTINNLPTVRAHLVSSDVVDESRSTTIAQAITHKFVTWRTTLPAATGARSSCLEIEDLAIETSLKIGVLALRHVWNGNDALRQTVEINLHSYRRTWTTLASTTRAFTTATTTFTSGFTRTRTRLQPARACADASILVALRQQRTRI